MTTTEGEHRLAADGVTRLPVPRNTRGRVVRGCDVCGQVDDHPKHLHGLDPTRVAAGLESGVPDASVVAMLVAAGGKAGLDDDASGLMLAEVLDATTVVRHPDCCIATGGCWDGSCDAMLARHGGKTRDPLVKALESETAKLTKEAGA